MENTMIKRKMKCVPGGPFTNPFFSPFFYGKEICSMSRKTQLNKLQYENCHSFLTLKIIYHTTPE
jgi:hypothetical protein